MASYLLTSFLIAFVFQCGLLDKCAGEREKKANSLGKISVKGDWFVDEDNRVVMFHGINAVEKSPPWVPNVRAHYNLTNTTHLARLKDWGFNVVRLGFMWSGVYPTAPDIINTTYINEMMQIVRILEQFGMYVILDMHQDMLSTQFASYDGAPRWILDQLPPPKHKYPWPFKNEYLGFTAYVTESCGFAFQCLYSNINNFEDYFQQYWMTTANVFNHTSSILAYELINEPWAGDVYANPLLFLPGVTDRMNLLPLYDRAYEKIRQYDPKTIVFYEPVTWGTMSNGTFFGTGFDHPPGHDAVGTAFSWHYYCWLLNFDTDPITNDTMPVFVKQFCDQWQLNLYFETVKTDLKRFGGGASFLTEFGVCIFKDPVSGEKNIDECKATMDAADKYIVSWTYWESEFYDEHFEINYQLVNAFSRVYPTATNGIPLSLYYNSTTRVFNYTYEMNLSSLRQALLTTDVFVPQHLYPKGFEVKVSDGLGWTFDKDSSKVLVIVRDELLLKMKNDFELSLKLLPKVANIQIYSPS